MEAVTRNTVPEGMESSCHASGKAQEDKTELESTFPIPRKPRHRSFARSLQSRLYRHKHKLLALCAYIAGSEVIWRMTDAWVFWETGKYFLTLFCLLGLFRKRDKKIPFLPVLYFALLLPSALLTIEHFAGSEL